MDVVSLLAGLWFSVANFFGFGGEGDPNNKPMPMPPAEQENTEQIDGMNERPPSRGGAPSTGSQGTPSGSGASGSDIHGEAPVGAVVEVETDNVRIYTDGTYRYIVSNGLPDHETGTFPNSGNPNSISEQSHSFRVPITPTYTGAKTSVQLPGVGLNGIPMEPGTAEREGNYNIEALQDTYNLGLDYSNAHVQPGGTYHYHGVPEGYIDVHPTNSDLIQVGWAADGFPMYHSIAGLYDSGWEFVDERSDGTAPDGTYTQDFEFTGTGDLDECNGVVVNGEYVYMLTDEFPYISRCLNGVPDESFSRGPGAGASGGASSGGAPSSAGPTGGAGSAPSQGSAPASPASSASGGGTPPAEATSACSGQSSGSSCSFTAPHGSVSGTCQSTPDGMACVPAGGPPPGGGR